MIEGASPGPDPAADPPAHPRPDDEEPAGQPTTIRPEPSSWAHYPAIDPVLRAAWAEDARADVVLAALADTLAPYRWASVDDWDNTGFVGAGTDELEGFVTRANGALAPQPDGAAQLGCAGGFLEGVRATLVPELGMTLLRACDDATLGQLGALAPDTCRSSDFGLHAIANVARAAARAGAATVANEPLHIDPSGDPHAFDPLLAPGPLHLCTVSHVSTTRPGTRLYHHMMILQRAPAKRAFLLFDTTGYRGVSQRRVDARGLVRYTTSALATNETFRYDPASTHVDCLALTRRR